MRCLFWVTASSLARSLPPWLPAFLLSLSGGGRWERGSSELRGWPQFPLGEGEMVVHRSQQVWGKHWPLTPPDSTGFSSLQGRVYYQVVAMVTDTTFPHRDYKGSRSCSHCVCFLLLSGTAIFHSTDKQTSSLSSSNIKKHHSSGDYVHTQYKSVFAAKQKK